MLGVMNLFTRSVRCFRFLPTKLGQLSPKNGNIVNRKLTHITNKQILSTAFRAFTSKTDYDGPLKDNKGDEGYTDSDSESDEDNKYSHRGESEFWRRKMRTFHRLLDVNKDGVVSYDDFALLTERFIDLGHISHKQIAEVKHLMQDVWEAQYGTVDPYNLITTELFLEEMHHALNDKQLRKKLHSFLPFLFKALDKDKSGKITVEEYKIFFKCLGLSNEDAVVSFHSIDENSDGRLSIKEFVHIGREFFLSEDETKSSKHFWGPLIKH